MISTKVIDVLFIYFCYQFSWDNLGESHGSMKRRGSLYIQWTGENRSSAFAAASPSVVFSRERRGDDGYAADGF